MRKGMCLALMLLVLSAAVSVSPGRVPCLAALDELDASATQLVDMLAKGNYTGVVGKFDGVMARGLPQDKLRRVWEGLAAQVGPFQRRGGLRRQTLRQFQIIFVTCRFRRATLDVKVVFNADKQVAGLFFVPTVRPAMYSPPAYVKRDSFTEKGAIVRCGRWALPGTLAVPKAAGAAPAVVLVHGSGPNDRDETIGPNRPFRDLAWGLASRGLAVLRYEKRTKEYAATLAANGADITVKDESIDDAVAAVALLRKTPGIDPKRVFVLGHSLGGYLIPRIARQDPAAAGFIVLAGSTRPTEDLIVDQLNYLCSLDGAVSQQEKDYLDRVKARAALVKDAKLSAKTPAAQLPFGVPAKYWLDLRGYDPAKSARAIKRPMLILQGGRDYQVTMADFDGWKKSLAGRPNVRLKVYPALNHLFIAGEGKSSPVEYQTPGHVAEIVIADIAAWVAKPTR